MKVAYFIGSAKNEGDGVNRVLARLIKEGEKRGVESMIVTGWVESPGTTYHVPIITIPSLVFPLYREYRFPLPWMKNFYPHLDAFKPDIIHVHSPDTSAWEALGYARKRGIPIMATHHTDFVRYLKYYHLSALKLFVWFLLRSLYNKLDLVTATSSFTGDDLVRHGVRNVRVVMWGADQAQFNPSFRSDAWRRKILKEGEKHVLFCASRLTWEKDLQTLAETYKMLREKRSDCAMAIAGDGPARKKLEAMMPGAVFLGRIGGREFSEAYASSDVLLFPSSTETFGNVTIEAMASGLVPVVANEGGSKSLVEDGVTGFLCAPRDPKSFFEKTTRLLDDAVLRRNMREAALLYAKDFTWDAVYGKMRALYEELIHTHKNKEGLSF